MTSHNLPSSPRDRNVGELRLLTSSAALGKRLTGPSCGRRRGRSEHNEFSVQCSRSSADHPMIRATTADVVSPSNCLRSRLQWLLRANLPAATSSFDRKLNQLMDGDEAARQSYTAHIQFVTINQLDMYQDFSFTRSFVLDSASLSEIDPSGSRIW